MQLDLTKGPIFPKLMRFSVPLIAGNLLQQMYNMVDTWVVGRFVGANALAAVGSAFSLLVLLTSIVLGLCMGSGVVFSQLWGAGNRKGVQEALGNSLLLVTGAALTLTIGSLCLLQPIMHWMNVPQEVLPGLQTYLLIVLPGMLASCVYNFVASGVRSVGNSTVPLLFLAISACVNVVLDILFVAVLGWGIAGAATATLIAQSLSAVGILLYALRHMKEFIPTKDHFRINPRLMKRLAAVSAMTSLQQSIMNFGILMIQSLVNSFGAGVMAAFAAGVKVDAFAYAPAQDFANGYATFISQNLGAQKSQRIKRGIGIAFAVSLTFCAVVSLLVWVFAAPLMGIFLDSTQQDVIAIGVGYLRTEGLCYVGIGALFLFYATYRGIEKASMSVVLTIISLGLRVLLAYRFAPTFGVDAIWWSIPIGWLMADLAGLLGLTRLLPKKSSKEYTAASD